MGKINWEKALKRVLAFFLLAVLVGCTTTQQATNVLQANFLGRNIDTFVIRYGVPIQRHQLNSGDLLYVWNSGVKSYGLPTTTTIQGYASPYGYSGTAVTSGGGAITVFCEVQIITSPDGTITSISPTRDTIGDWTTSRCAELFKE